MNWKASSVLEIRHTVNTFGERKDAAYLGLPRVPVCLCSCVCYEPPTKCTRTNAIWMNPPVQVLDLLHIFKFFSLPKVFVTTQKSSYSGCSHIQLASFPVTCQALVILFTVLFCFHAPIKKPMLFLHFLHASFSLATPSTGVVGPLSWMQIFVFMIEETSQLAWAVR